MSLAKRMYLIAGLVVAIALAVAAVTLVAPGGSAIADGARQAVGIDDNGPPENAGKLDDGKDLLPQAEITLEQAIASAQTAASGSIGEIDLEYYNGKLVFNVDVGSSDVKVDAATGEVLGSGSD